MAGAVLAAPLVAGTMNAAWRAAALKLLGQAVPVFLLIMVRTAGMLQQAPVIGARTIPGMARAGVTLALSFVYFWTLPNVPAVPHEVLPFILAALDEFGFGYLFGMASMLMFYAFQSAGELVAQATGLSMMTTLNPSLRTQTTAVGNLFFYLSQATFLALGGELWFLSGYFQSFELVPLGGFRLDANTWTHATELVLAFWFIVIQMAMPAVILMFLVDFGLGIINRSSPSVQNILGIVQSIKPTVGFLILALMVPNFVTSIGHWADKMLRESQAIVSPQLRGPVAPGISR